MADLDDLDDLTVGNLREIMQDENLTRELCECFTPAPGDPDNESKIVGFRNVLKQKEKEVLDQLDEELSRLRGDLARKVRNELECKLDILNVVMQDVVQSGGAKPRISDALRSLLTFEVRRVEGFRCESFAYIRGCDALPQRLHFVESYEAQEYHVGSTVKMYYLSSMGYDPHLIHYIGVSVSHETGEDEVKVSNCDLLNGMYHLEFVVDREGTYEARVTLYDRDINGSPQKITVRSAPVHEWLDRGTAAGITDATMTGNIGGSVVPNAVYNEWPIHAARKGHPVSDLASREHDSKLLTIRTNELRSDFQPPVLQTLSVEGPSSSDSSKIFESVKAVPGHCSNLVMTSTSDLDSYIQQPVFRALPSPAEQCPSDTRISEPPPNSALGKLFSRAGPPHQQATTARSGVFNSQISASSGLSLDLAGSSNLSSSRPILQRAHIATSEAVLQPPQVAKSENTSSCGSSLLNDKPGALKTGSGKCMEEPLKPAYVVKTIPSDSSTKLSSANVKVRPLSTHKKEHVSFSGTITAKFTLEIQYYNNLKLSFPIGVTTTSSGKIIVANTSQNSVVMFDPEGRYLHEATFLHSSESLVRPSAVVALEDESYAVKDNHCIYVFSKNGEFIRKLGASSLCRPYGLALQGKENLFTLSLGDSVPTLRCYSASGSFEKCSVYGPLVPSPPAGSKCRFMDIHDGHIFVSDLGLSCIYKTDMKGALVSTFGTKGKNCGQMVEPSGISATERCIFIGDSKNDRVQAFDASGKFITVVDMDCGIRRPSGIHVSEANKLYVLNYLKGALGVYDLYFNESAP